MNNSNQFNPQVYIPIPGNTDAMELKKALQFEPESPLIYSLIILFFLFNLIAFLLFLLYSMVVNPC